MKILSTCSVVEFCMIQCDYSSGDDKGVLVLWNYEAEAISTWLPVPSSVITVAASLHRKGLLAVGLVF